MTRSSFQKLSLAFTIILLMIVYASNHVATSSPNENKQVVKEGFLNHDPRLPKNAKPKTVKELEQRPKITKSFWWKVQETKRLLFGPSTLEDKIWVCQRVQILSKYEKEKENVAQYCNSLNELEKVKKTDSKALNKAKEKVKAARDKLKTWYQGTMKQMMANKKKIAGGAVALAGVGFLSFIGINKYRDYIERSGNKFVVRN